MPATGRGLVGADLYGRSDVHVEVGKTERDCRPTPGLDFEDHVVGGVRVCELVEFIFELADDISRDGERMVGQLRFAVPVKLYGCAVQEMGELGHGCSFSGQGA